MKPEKMALKEIFEKYSSRKWIFVAPGGNQGDKMIYLGAFKIADQVRLKYRKVTYKRNKPVYPFNKNKVVYLQGGGGWNTWWNWTPRLLRKIRKANPKNLIIIGPTTTTTDKEYLEVIDMDDRMIFFAREQTTYDIMQDYCSDIRLDHDTGVHLKLGDGYLEVLTRKLKSRADHSLLVLRKDIEKPQNLPKIINVKSFTKVLDPCLTDDWAKLHMHASKIVSNRSHSAIMGAILGKDTSIFAGSYHKNKSIWEYSLKDLGVRWIE